MEPWLLVVKPRHSSRWGWYHADQGFQKLNITLPTLQSEKKSRVCRRALEHLTVCYFFSWIGSPSHFPLRLFCTCILQLSSRPSVVLGPSLQVTSPEVAWKKQSLRFAEPPIRDREAGWQVLARACSLSSTAHVALPHSRPWRQEHARPTSRCGSQQPSRVPPPFTPDSGRTCASFVPASTYCPAKLQAGWRGPHPWPFKPHSSLSCVTSNSCNKPLVHSTHRVCCPGEPCRSQSPRGHGRCSRNHAHNIPQQTCRREPRARAHLAWPASLSHVPLELARPIQNHMRTTFRTTGHLRSSCYNRGKEFSTFIKIKKLVTQVCYWKMFKYGSE